MMSAITNIVIPRENSKKSSECDESTVAEEFDIDLAVAKEFNTIPRVTTSTPIT